MKRRDGPSRAGPARRPRRLRRTAWGAGGATPGRRSRSPQASKLAVPRRVPPHRHQRPLWRRLQLPLAAARRPCAEAPRAGLFGYQRAGTCDSKTDPGVGPHQPTSATETWTRRRRCAA
eukprot:scaffold156_cov308-Prasinococcus_capsulatus_cf.AAC.24